MTEPLPGSGGDGDMPENPTAPWAEGRRRLAEAGTYWLSTVRADGAPHTVPLLAVWVDEALHVSTSPESAKARHLAREPRCVVATSHDGLDLVLEGRAVPVDDPDHLTRVSEAYATKYGWPTEVRDGALWGEGAPTAGPPPYRVFQVVPETGFGFPTEEGFGPARWRFR